MSIFTERKVDCHTHVLDPAQFPYGADARYRPAGQEIATAKQMKHVFDTYGVHNALLVQPNSGYEADNACLLDAIEGSGGRFKGVAIVPHGISIDDLAALQARGVVGVAFNLAFHGPAAYAGTEALLAKLAELNMILQIQVEGEQFLQLLPMIERTKTRLLLDHCGRPIPEQGLQQPAFQALLRLGREGRAAVKLSGYTKFSRMAYPFADTWPFIHALANAFTIDACVWASDWPFLRAPERVDYGPLLTLFEQLFPDRAARESLLWTTPRRLFGFVN